MKRIIGLGLAVIIVLGGAVLLLRPILAPALFERAVEARLAQDRLADLGPGLHVVLIGTGSPLPDPTRAGPMTAVVADGRLFVFDAGGGSVRRMGDFGLSGAQVERVFLTHLHSDHIDGLGELMLQHWAGSGATEPLPIAGPAGTAGVVEGLMQVYAPDRAFRIAHHGEDVMPPSGYGGTAAEIEPGLVYEDGSLRITAFTVDHDPVEPAFGYLVAYDGKRVVITGDSTADIVLPPEAEAPDVLIAEALNPDMVKVMEEAARAAGNDRLAKIFYDIPDYHMSPADAVALGERIGAGRVVLTHIVPAVPNRIAERLFLDGADAEIGHDGMVISLR